MDAQKSNVDFFRKYSQFQLAGPVLKMTWMMLLLAIKDKCKVITFSRKRGKKGMTVKLDHEHDMVPPPRHLFSEIVKTLRRVGCDAAKNAQSPFSFIYTATGREQKLDWMINHDTALDLYEEMGKLLQKVHDAEEAERQRKNHEYKRRVQQRRLVVTMITTVVLIGLAILAGLSL